MHFLIAAIVGLALTCTGAPAQEDYAKFRARLEQDLRQHPFFTKIVFTLVDRPPFLFCIERSSNDEKDYEIGIVNGYLPFLRELQAQFEEDYQRPCELVRSPDAGGYAIAILSSGGRYLDFRTAIGDPSLAFARAHYTPSLRLAVTYVDTFARDNTSPEERHAVLHEFVHALQHAHAKDGQMPKPVWFNEGLADYRASSTNVATSLREPEQQLRHLTSLAFAYGNPAGRYYVAPIADLVSADSYKDVLDLAQKRNGVAVPAEAVLGIFYSQAEMFVRFLHEGEKRKYEAGFLRYMRAAQRGESGLAVFQKALNLTGPDAMAVLEAEWLRWLDTALRVQYPGLRDLTKEAGKGVTVPMAPPIAFDTTGLRWTAEDLTERLAGVRRLCARGEYEAALALLPEDSEQVPPAEREFVPRERARIAALVKLRDDALADHLQKGAELSVTSGANKLKGKVVRCSAQCILLRVGKAETEVPLNVMTPAVLVGAGNRLDRFSKDRWLEIWTRWLKGDSLASLQGLLKLDQKAITELKRDLPRDLDARFGVEAAAVTELMRIPQVDDAQKAQASLAQLQSLLREHGKSPLLVRRKQAIEKLARALAERAFRVDDLSALGIRGSVTGGKAGAFRVDYTDSASAPNADFSPLSKEELGQFLAGQGKIAHKGASGLLPAQPGYQLVGSTAMRWAVALRGQQTIELEFCVNADFVPDCGIAMCAAEGRMLLVSPTGGVMVFDSAQDVGEPIGGGAMLQVGKTHTLKLEHDGKKTMRVSLDGAQTALVPDVGRLTGGEVVLFVHSTTPLQVSRLSISGVPSPLDPQQIRERYVAGVIAKLWP